MFKPVDWTVGIPASTLITTGTQVRGRFPLDGASVREVRYRLDDGNITSYIVYDDNGRAIKRVDLTGKAHAGIPTPHVVEYKQNQNPAGDIFVQVTFVGWVEERNPTKTMPRLLTMTLPLCSLIGATDSQ